MKPLFNIVFVMLAAAACRQDDAEENQRKSIESALGEAYQSVNGIYLRRLRHPMCDTMIVSEIAADDGSIASDTTHYGECAIIDGGKIITFAYSAKIFKGALFATTDTGEAAAAGIYPQPLEAITIGGGIVEGVRRALMLLTTGDSASVVFPYTLGYGAENYVGIVPPMSAQEWTIVVKDIR